MDFVDELLTFITCLNDHDVDYFLIGGVATPKALYELKSNTVRPIDRADANRLAEAFDLEDE